MHAHERCRSVQSLQSDASHDLEVLLRSRIPLIVIETRDETRVLEMLALLSVRVTRNAHTPMFEWTVTDGLKRIDVDLGRHNATTRNRPRSSSTSARRLRAGVYVLRRLSSLPGRPDPRAAAEGHLPRLTSRSARTVVLMSARDCRCRASWNTSPHAASSHSPIADERRAIVQEVARDWVKHAIRATRCAPTATPSSCWSRTSPVSRPAIHERLARKAIFDDGALSPSDLPGDHAGQVRAAQSQRRAHLRARHGAFRRCRRADAPQGVARSSASRPSTAARRSSIRRRACCCSACRAAARASRRAPRPESAACRCCAWTSARCTTSASASRSGTCASRSPRPR